MATQKPASPMPKASSAAPATARASYNSVTSVEGSPQRVSALGGSGTVAHIAPHNGTTAVSAQNTVSTLSGGPPGDDAQSANEIRFSPGQPLTARLNMQRG
jgi:hypothetical protein